MDGSLLGDPFPPCISQGYIHLVGLFLSISSSSQLNRWGFGVLTRAKERRKRADRCGDGGHGGLHGAGARAADGTLVPPGVAVGDKVMLPEFGGTGVDLGDDRELVVFRSDELLGVLQ